MKIEIPKINRRMLESVRFVLRAAAKENTRHALQHVLVEKGRFVATDGHRLHIADIEHNFKPGIYEILQNSAKGVVLLIADGPEKFPKYQDIIPKHKDYFEMTGSWEKWTLTTNIAFGLANKGIQINPQFLAEGISEDTLKVYFGTPDRPIILVAEEGTKAVLMPTTPPSIRYEKGK